MAGKKGLRSVLALVLTLCLICLSSISPFSAATNLNDLQQRQRALSNRQKELSDALDAVRGDKEKQLEYKAMLDEQILTLEAQIDLSNEKIYQLTEQINQKSAEISDTEQMIDEDMERLKKRLHAIYLAGEASTWDLILGAEDFDDFLDKTELIRSVSEHDTFLIETLRRNKLSIEEEKTFIEENLAVVAQEKKNLDARQTELTALLEESEAILAELDIAEGEAQEAKLQADAEKQKIDAEIDQWWVDYYAEQKKQQQQSQAPTVYYPTGEGCAWPVPGYTWLSQGYHGGHRAIDIAGVNIYGKPIVATQSGQVVYVNIGGWGYGYGNYLMIDHGNGFGTLYAHCSNVVTSVGQRVQKGQIIAYVGSTGNSTGPHLHFETRQNGVKYNPMNLY